MDDLQRAFDLLSTVLWIASDFAIAAVALYRFRTRPPGLLIGGGFALIGLKALAHHALRWLHLIGSTADGTAIMIGSSALTLLLLLLVAVGVLCIPSSLAAMARSDQHSA
jgi:hypothetical protein